MKKAFIYCFSMLGLVASLTSCGVSDPIEPLATPELTIASNYIRLDGAQHPRFENRERVKLRILGKVPGGVSIFQITKTVGSNAPVIVSPTSNVQAGTVDIDYTTEVEVGRVSATSTINEPVGSITTLSFETRNAQGTRLTIAQFKYEVVAQGQGGGGIVRNLQPLTTNLNLATQTVTAGKAYYASMAAGQNGLFTTDDINYPTFSAKKYIDITVGTSDVDGVAQTGTAATRNVLISPKERATKGFDNPLGADATETTFKATTFTALTSLTSTDVHNIDHSTGATKFVAFGNSVTANTSIYSFVNGNGLKGFVRIVSITPEATGSDKRTIRLDVLVQR